MRRIFIFALLALTMAGGVAGADGYRHRDSGTRYQRGGVTVQRSYPRYRHNYYRPSYNARVYVQPSVRIVRHPIYVQRPLIRYRYYNYYQRPAVIIENQLPMTGYIYVAGQWQWNGYEWIWQPGHYQPDSAYDSYNGYDTSPSYDGSYYNNGY
jgi:hypothetical protein